MVIIAAVDTMHSNGVYVERTNVYKFAQALANGDVIDYKGQAWEQIHTYYSGLGTSRYKILGGLFGYGISGQIKSAYKYICEHYRDERDEIWLIGFSRGGMPDNVISVNDLWIDYKKQF